MAQVQVMASGTAAVTAKQPFETNGYSGVIVSADNLATTEEVDIFVNVGGTWKTLVDASGTAVKLTATITFQNLQPGPCYAVVKDATAGSCGVFVDYLTEG
jgi:hypothetical protein